MADNYNNTASVAQLSAPITNTSTSVTLTGYTGYPPAPFWAEINRGTPTAEVVKVTNVGGSTLTISRGQDGTVATGHGAGDTFEHIVAAHLFNAVDQHIDASTNVHGLTGGAAVVGTTGSQTVQDKVYRGSHRSVYSDALPAGVTASFESTADTTASRDGFVHHNTAADANRRGVLVDQSGTPRFQVFNDGTVDVTPASGSSRPGLRNRGTTQLDGATNVDGAFTATSTGSVTSDLHVGGSFDVDGSAAVDGALTALGLVTGKSFATPIPSVGDTAARLDINTRSGANVLRARNEVGTVLATVNSTGDLGLAGHVTASDVAASLGLTAWGGNPAVLSVPTATTVVTPTSGQVVYDQGAGCFKRWTGTVWVNTPSPLGVVARASRATTGTAGTTPAIGSLRIDNVPLKSGRLYKVSTTNMLAQVTGSTDTRGNIMLTFSATGTATATGTVLPGAFWRSDNVQRPSPSGISTDPFSLVGWVVPGADANYGFMLAYVRTNGTGTIASLGSTDMPQTILVEDCGLAPADTGVSL